MSKGLLLAALLLAGCALLVPQSSLDSLPRGAPPPAKLLAGAARVALTPVPHPVPLAGFGPHPTLSRGQDGELYARAVSLRGAAEIASGVERVVLVSADLLIVTRAVAQAVRERTRDLERTRVIVAATHTHEGIGGFWPGGLPEWASIGPYDAAETARVVSAIALAVHEAAASERAASVAWGVTERRDLVESRVHHTRLTDAELLALSFAAADGAPIAKLVFFASHPTELYGTDLLSAAWPGTMSAELERPGGVALLFQQGLGDQRPAFPPEVYADLGPLTSGGRAAKSHAYGRAVARAAIAALESRQPAETCSLRLAQAPYSLPPPTVGMCPIPLLDRAIALPVVLPYWPRTTHVSALRVGEVVLVFAPFELCASSSLRAKDELREAGFAHAAVVSIADDWLGYAPDLVPLPWTTSGAASFGGVGIGHSVASRLVELGERLRDGP